MFELITTYLPVLFIIIAAVFLYAAGHHVGTTSVGAAKVAEREPAKVAKIVEPSKPLELAPVEKAAEKSNLADKLDAAKDVGLVGTEAKPADILDKILPERVSDTLGNQAQTVQDIRQDAIQAHADKEVAKAHDALDKAGVYGPNRLIAIASVRAGQVSGDDVARAYPAVHIPQVEAIAPAEVAPQ